MINEVVSGDVTTGLSATKQDEGDEVCRRPALGPFYPLSQVRFHVRLNFEWFGRVAAAVATSGPMMDDRCRKLFPFTFIS